MMKRVFLEGAALVGAAILCALVANALAARERKLALVGSYPNALNVPGVTAPGPAVSTPAPASPAPAGTGTITETSVAQAPSAAAPAAAPPATATAPATSGAATPAPAATPAVPKPAPVDLSKFQPHPDKPAVEIGYADVAALHAAGALILDARRTSIYEQGHIAGARSFSVWESDIDQKVNALFAERGDPRKQLEPIVIYCSGGECEDSHMLAQKLWGIQFNNVYVYKDGYPDWVRRGGPVRTGGSP